MSHLGIEGFAKGGTGVSVAGVGSDRFLVRGRGKAVLRSERSPHDRWIVALSQSFQQLASIS